MKPSLAALMLFSGCTLLAVPARAEPSPRPAAPAEAAGTAAAPAAATARPPLLSAAAAAPRQAVPMPPVRVTAAGSVFYWVDGAVTRVQIAPAAAPAPGFVYER